MNKKTKLPSFLSLLWLFFMQPVTLHNRLKKCGIEKPDAPLLELWQTDDNMREIKHWYVLHMLAIILLIVPIASLLMLLFLDMLTYPIDFTRWFIGVLFGIGFGIAFSIAFGLIVGVAIGVATGLAGSVAFEIAFGALGGVAFGVAAGIAYGVVYGVSKSVVGGVTFGVAFGVVMSAGIATVFGSTITVDDGIILSIVSGITFGSAIGVAYAAVFGVVYDTTSGIVYGIVGGVGIGIGVGIAGGFQMGVVSGSIFSLCFAIAYFRIPLYFLEAFWQTLCYMIQSGFNRPSLHFSPVLYHNLSYLPYPFLAQHIIAFAETNAIVTQKVLHACAIAPGQRQAGKIALCHLQALELLKYVRAQQFAQIVNLQGQWLAGVEGNDPLLLAVRDIARYLQAAHTATIAYHRLQHLERAEHAFANLSIRLLADSSHLAKALRTTLPTWKNVIDELREATKVVSRRELPNPFRAGEPLTPTQGSELFRGRQKIIEQIEFLLADPSRNHSIAVLGPRRCGKTSLLNMLPVMLPDTICVFFDLQDNPIDSPAGFFQALAQRTKEQAWRDRRVNLPLLPQGSAFEAGSQWLQSLDKLTQGQRILFCIDEFERLESVFPGERRELLQLMGLFRATIQHRHYIRLLISGAAPFNELDSLWSDHFINLQEVQIGHLSKAVSFGLLTQPITHFPEKAISLEIAEQIFTRTGGQPYLLQLYGFLLIQHLNTNRRKQAVSEDIESIEEQVLEQATYYFRNTVQLAPKAAQNALEELATGATPALDRRTHLWLKRRYLVDDKGKLLVPVLGKWIATYW